MAKSSTGNLIHDYNGEGRWTVVAVQTRYFEYCRRYGVESPSPPIPREHVEGNKRWVYPVMQAVIEGIERGDKASIALGLDFIEEDGRCPFPVWKNTKIQHCESTAPSLTNSGTSSSRSEAFHEPAYCGSDIARVSRVRKTPEACWVSRVLAPYAARR